MRLFWTHLLVMVLALLVGLTISWNRAAVSWLPKQGLVFVAPAALPTGESFVVSIYITPAFDWEVQPRAEEVLKSVKLAIEVFGMEGWSWAKKEVSKS